MHFSRIAAGILCSSILAGCGGGSNEVPQSEAPAATTSGAAEKFVPISYRFTKDSAPQTIWVTVKGGNAYFQSDINLGPIERLREAEFSPDSFTAESGGREAAGVIYPSAGRWYKGVVVYNESQLPASVRDGQLWTAMNMIMAKSPIRFSRDQDYYKNVTYISSAPVYTYDNIALYWQNFDGASAGSSQIGRQGGTQGLFATDRLSAAGFAHEFLHALGVWHEQSRSDRDTYISVDYGNIKTEYRSQYDKHVSDGALVGGYDYCSVMHYPAKGGGMAIDNAKPIIKLLQNFPSCIVQIDAVQGAGVSGIGQDSGVSDGDFATIRALHPGVPELLPFAYAGPNQKVITPVAWGTAAPVTFSLNASKSYHPNWISNGARIVSYSWVPVGWSPTCSSQYPGGPVTCSTNPIVNANSAQATYSVVMNAQSSQEERKVRLTVTDNAGRSMSDVVTLTAARY